MDIDIDDRLSLNEITDYCKVKFLPFTDDEIYDLFRDAASGRGIVHEA
jgi:hypothetical protein